ncbi:hypothetical protein HPP92_017386 [Vanilla planifolia]|nr:hypothetical protein HPP92_017386 [Vanilla planifolia]
MGCCFSRNKSEPFNGVRVLHINGHLEGFDAPVTACEITGKPPYQLLFSPVHLLSGYAKPLQANEQLEPGRVYFLLPYSVLQTSPADLTALAIRLCAVANRSAKVAPVKGTIRPALVQTVGEVGCVRQDMRLPRVRPWKPVLETIRELSFRRTMERLESNLTFQRDQPNTTLANSASRVEA